MKLNRNRFFILCKRSLLQPVNLAMLITLLLLALIYNGIPTSERSVYIPVAILCEDDDPLIIETAEEMITRNSIFHFYAVSSREEMYNDISGGKANSGLYLPAGLGKEVTNIASDVKIIMYISPASLLPSLCRDEIFNVLFRKIALRMAREKVAATEPYSDMDPAALDQLLEETYQYYTEGSEIFRVEDTSGGVYNAITREEKTELPVRKLAGLFIFAAGMMGIATYLKDKEERLYDRLRRSERPLMRLFHIASAILPITLISWPVILVTEGGNPAMLLLRIFLYALACIAYATLFGFLLRRSAVYQKVLPVILTLAILLGGVIFDVSKFEQSMRILSMLFPPYYF